jgi:hypothetical protein
MYDPLTLVRECLLRGAGFLSKNQRVSRFILKRVSHNTLLFRAGQPGRNASKSEPRMSTQDIRRQASVCDDAGL